MSNQGIYYHYWKWTHICGVMQYLWDLFSFDSYLCVSLFLTMYALEVLYAQIMCKDWEACSKYLDNLHKFYDTLIHR